MSEIFVNQPARPLVSGKERRVNLPRKAFNVLGDRPSGFDPVVLLEAQGVNRVPELLPLRYSRMADNEFAFLRGAAAIMAFDLALAPNTGLDAQICGDAHLSNFGVFYSPERTLVFDVNDFDETLPGPFEWDLKRLVASAAVAFSSMGFSEKDVMSILTKAMAVYRTAMKEFAQQGTLEVWYARFDVGSNFGSLKGAFRDEQRAKVDDVVSQARKRTSKSAFKKLIVEIDGELKFRSDPPLLVPIQELQTENPEISERIVRDAFNGFHDSLPADRLQLMDSFMARDIARKVVGVGSVGTRCFVVLYTGSTKNDPLILQVKEAMPSVLEAHLGPSVYPTAGQRVVEGQRMMQTTPDIFLGHTRLEYSESEFHDFYFRQFRDGKASADLAVLDSPQLATSYTAACAWTLARAHARSGNRMEIAAYLGGGSAADVALAEWGTAYQERNRADYATFTAAIASGRLSVMEDPKKK